MTIRCLFSLKIQKQFSKFQIIERNKNIGVTLSIAKVFLLVSSIMLKKWEELNRCIEKKKKCLKLTKDFKPKNP